MGHHPTLGRLLGLAAVLATPAISAAQTGSVAISIPEFAATTFPGVVVTLPVDQLDPTAEYLVFRLSTDYTVSRTIAVPDAASLIIQDPVNAAHLTDEFRSTFEQRGPTLNVGQTVSIEILGTFDSNPAPLASLEALVDSGGSLNSRAIFSSTLLEFFTADDIPSSHVGGGPLAAAAPTPALDLGVINVAGEQTILDVSPTPGDAAGALFAGDGTPLALGRVLRTPLSDLASSGVLAFLGDETPDIRRDGSIAFTTLAPGEYLFAVTAEIDFVEGGFSIEPDDDFAVDAVVVVNGVQATIPVAEFDNDIAWFGFKIAEAGGCNEFDLVEPFGVFSQLDAAEFVSLFFADSPVVAAYALPTDVVSQADVAAFVAAFFAGCPGG